MEIKRLLLVLVVVLDVFAGGVEVELRLVVHDQPDTTVDQRERERPLTDLVATEHGVEARKVGLDLACWARNVLLDGQPVFERYHEGKYIGRRPVARKPLPPGDHTLWPGNHVFTVGKDGTVATQDPELLVDGQVVRVKCYPLTIRAYRANPDEGELPMSMRVTPLPDLTVREAADHEESLKPKPAAKARELLPVFDSFAPLTLWLPANKAGKGYVLHPVGLTCHLGAEGVTAGAGGGQAVEGLRVAGNTIEIPLYGYPVEGVVGARLVVPGVEEFKWDREAGRQITNWYPRQAPYELRLAETGPVVQVEGDLRKLPVKSFGVDVSDRAKGTQRAVAVEVAARQLTPGQPLHARVRAIEATAGEDDPLASAPLLAQIRPYGGSEWTDLKLRQAEGGNAEIAVPDLPDGVYRLRLGVKPQGGKPLATEQWVGLARKRPVALGLFTARGRDAFYRGEAFWLGLGILAIGEAIPAETPVEVDLVDPRGQRLPLLRQALPKPVAGRGTLVVQVNAPLSLALAPGRYRVEAKVGAHAARPLALDIVDPAPRTHFANVLVGKYNVAGDIYQRILRTGEGAEALARETVAMGYNAFIGMTYDISRVFRHDLDLEQIVRERPELGPVESYYQPSGRDRFLNAAVRHNLHFYENVFTYNDTMLPREPKILDACERYASLEAASMRHSPALKGVCLYDEFYDSADTGTAMSQMFLKAQEVVFRERHEGLTSAEALKALDRFASRPAGHRRVEDLDRYRTWPAHDDWDWRNFSERMTAAVRRVMPASRNLTLQRFWGGNGGNIAPNGTSGDVFAPLDIAACVMYKDGGYGDRPVFAPMQADVLRVRDGLPVWTQLHSFGSPPIYGDHLLRQAFFGLSQKIEGFTYFTLSHDYRHPSGIDNRSTVRDIAEPLCTRYGDLFAAWQRGYKKVAVYYSRTADHLYLRKANSLPHACEGLWVACVRAGFPADFLYDADILAGRGMDYQVVFAPGFTYEEEAPPPLLAALKRLVGAGKTLAVERASKLPIEGIVRLDSDLNEYDDKQGGAFPRNIDFESEMVWEGTEETTKLVRAFLAKRIQPAAEHDLLVGPDWLRCGQAEYLVIPNFAYTKFTGLYKTLYQAPDTPTLRFPRRPPACYDMLEMKPAEVKSDGDWMSLKADLRAYQGKIYAFLPAPIARLDLRATASVKAGEGIHHAVSVLDASGKTIDAGFPLEIALRDPAGGEYQTVYRAATPSYAGVFHLPVNVAAGNWTLRVRELISGAFAEMPISVQPGELPTATLDERTVRVHDAGRIQEFLKAKAAIVIAVDAEQAWVRPHAQRLAQALGAAGREAKVASVADAVRLPVDWNGDQPTIDGTRLWRGNVVDPGLFVDAPLILLGKRYENRLIEAIVRRDLLAEPPIGGCFPGPGRAIVAWAPRAFSNAHDTVCLLASDAEGVARSIDALLALKRGEQEGRNPKSETRNVKPETVAEKLGREPSSFRDAINREDLIRAVDVDPASGRVVVGTNGFGHNLFCFSPDGKLLWKQFLPEHNVYTAQWFDGGKRVVAAVGRGFHVFLLDGADGKVLKKFASTEWPRFHGGFNTYQEGAINTEVPVVVNPPLRQILIGGLTGILAADFDGKRMWYRDRAEAIAAYPAEAVQTAGAEFGRTVVVGDFALSPDGARLAHGEYAICGSTQVAPDKIAPVWKYTPMILDARTGQVITQNDDDPGNHTSPWGWWVTWPAGSPVPWVHSKGLAFPLQADGKRGELVAVQGSRLGDGGRLLAEPKSLERRDAKGQTLWAARSETIWVPELDRLSLDEGRLFRCDRNGLVQCVDMKTGRQLWEHKLPFPAVLRPTPDGIVAGTQNGAVARLDAAGKLLWQTRLRDHHEVPPSDYPAYVRQAEQRDPDSTEEFFPVGQDRPDDFKDILRMGLEQVENRGFESKEAWDGEARFAAPGRTGRQSLALAAGQLVTQKLQRKVVPSATYLLEFFYRVGDARTRMVAGALLRGGKETLTASKFAARPGEWAFGRLAVKTMADTTGIEVGFEAEGGAALVDDVSLRPVRFPSANLLADPELHAIEPTFVRDIRVQYNRIPASLTDKLRSRNHVVALKQGLVSTATRFAQEQALLHNGRLDDVGPVWFYQPDSAAFSVVLTRAAYVSHLVLYLNNATPDNVYSTISVVANNLETKLPEAVALVRCNRRRFIVVHFPKLLHTDAIKVLPGVHRARNECLTEIEVYGPLGGPEMAKAGTGLSDDPLGAPMFMSAPSHVPAKLPPDLVGDYAELGRLSIHQPAYYAGTTAMADTFTFGDANGRIRSVVVREPDPKDRSGRWMNWGPVWNLATVTPTTTPARYRGRLLVGSADYRLHAVGDNGMPLWSYPTEGRVCSSPTPSGDEVYFGSDDGRLYKVDVDSGLLLWEFPTGGKVRSAPALAADRVFFASWDGFLYALDAARGTLAWKAPIAQFTRSSPAVHEGRVLIGDEEGRLHAFDAASGKPLWSVDIGGYVSCCPVVTPEGVAAVSDQGIAALVGHDGAVRWKRDLGTRLTGQPVATQSQLLVPTEKGPLVLRRADGQPDPRLRAPESPGKVIALVPYGDKLFLVAARAVSDTRVPPRTYVSYEGAAIAWGPKREKTSAK